MRSPESMAAKESARKLRARQVLARQLGHARQDEGNFVQAGSWRVICANEDEIRNCDSRWKASAACLRRAGVAQDDPMRSKYSTRSRSRPDPSWNSRLRLCVMK